MKSRNSELIKDLLSLYVKYGPEAFEAAVRDLRERNVTEVIAEAVEHLDDAARAWKIKRAEPSRTPLARKSKREQLLEHLSRIKNAGRRPEIEIADFIERIANRKILRTPAALREYMAFIDIPVANRHGDRYDEARRLLEHLKNLPDYDLRERIDAAERFRAEDSSLQRWANIIVKSDH